jgi:PBP1b-binding outer membrane lipoprotein LpoB
MLNRSTITKLALASVLVLFLTACAQTKPDPTTSPSPTETQTQAQIDAEFIKIANDSCAKAQKENIVEELIDDAPAKIIALARANAYRDYSAIYLDNKGVATVVYELELTVCGPGYLLSMQEEANHDNSGDYEHHIKKNSETSYTWTQATYSEEGSVLADTIFEVADGIIVQSVSDRDARKMVYGPISDSDMQVFKASIDAELERLED